jgi:TolA-binding protein
MRGALAAVLALAIGGCWVPAERGRQMERRIERLEAENELVTRQLEDQRELLRDRVAKADAKIAEVQKKLDELNATAHRSGADVVARQDQLQQEVARLRGLLEESQHRVALVEQQLAQARQESEGRFAALKGAGALEQYETRKKLEAVKRPQDPRGYLALAREQEGAGEKGVAAALYDELAKKWPKDPSTAEAHFRLGDLHAGDGRHREAVLAYGKVAQEFPQSERAPEAMLKTGDALVELGLKDEAIGVWKELQAKHPRAPAAKLAKDRIADATPPTKVKIGPKNGAAQKKR